jgi:hypothetical protein
MRYLTAVVALSLLLAVAGTAGANSWYQDGGDRLVALQNDDGGWDWPLDDGDPASASPKNTVAPITMGLITAYEKTGDAAMLTAIQNAGGLLLGKTNDFSPSDGYLAAALDKTLGGTTYTTHVMNNFYTPLASGTYDRNGAGTLYDTAGYVQLIRDARAGQGIPNLAAWDVGMGLYAANMIGSSTSEWIAGTKAEINELTIDGRGGGTYDYYDVVGLAGGVLGLSAAGETAFDPTSGAYAGADSLAELADALSALQLGSGGFTWTAQLMGPGDESIQETAYAILALEDFDASAYADAILDARTYLAATQLSTGGWEQYTGGGENNEITGEALWGEPVPEPLTMAGLMLGVGGLVGYVRRRRQM